MNGYAELPTVAFMDLIVLSTILNVVSFILMIVSTILIVVSTMQYEGVYQSSHCFVCSVQCRTVMLQPHVSRNQHFQLEQKI